MGYALFLFRLSLFEGWTYIGDSDRLNNMLNLRLFEVFSILKRGSVPSWNEWEFMGYGVSGVHWMLPGAPPLPQLLAMVPLSELYRALGLLAVILFTATMLATYWALGVYSIGPVQRVVGTLLYATGAYTFHKMTQLDIAFLALVAPPILHRLVYMTTRERAPWTFLGMSLCWSVLMVLTVLQEVAYVGLFWGIYALYRSVRLRDPWPLVAAGLAFVIGVTIATPRIITIATEMSVVARTSTNVQNAAIEAVRYFGDGLLGRSQGEQRLLLIPPVNLHEGVQLLNSSLAALAVIAIGLITPSRWLRFWSTTLLVVISVALIDFFPSFYKVGKVVLVGGLIGGLVGGLLSNERVRGVVLERGIRRVSWGAIVFGLVVGLVGGLGLGLAGELLGEKYPSLALQAFAANALLIGVPMWLLGRWLTRTSETGRVAGDRPDTVWREPPAVAEDLPFLLGFVTLALAAILIPEVRLFLYYSFMKVDFQHSRISVAMTLPMAIIAVVLLNRFLPTGALTVVGRWLVIGVAISLVLWIGRAVAGAVAAAQFGPGIQALQPWPLVTVEAVRVLASLLVLLVAVTMLVRRVRSPWLTVAGGALASWMVLETVGLADHRLNGPPATAQSHPFAHLDYMQVPPGQMRAPSLAERAAVQERLESDQYRTILIEDRATFPAHADPHLAAFWGLRLIEGYSTGSPRRYERLPWSSAMASAHHVDIHDEVAIDSLPWELLAALNVKYVVIVDRSFWLNPAEGGSVPPFDLSQLKVTENPYPVTPRAFFSARVSPAREPPRLAGDDGRRPAMRSPPIEQPRRNSVAEGIQSRLLLSTEGTIEANFDGDRVHVRVDPLGEDRFLVLNEMYHPGWRATVDGQPTHIYPANVVMRGIWVPAGSTTIELSFVPFVYSPPGYAIMAGGVLLVILFAWGLRAVDLVSRAPFVVWRRDMLPAQPEHGRCASVGALPTISARPG